MLIKVYNTIRTMKIKSFVKPPIDNNNYLLIDEATKEAALIDCSTFDDEILTAIDDEGAVLKYVLLTHGHFDHITGLNDTDEDVEVLMHQADMEWITELNTYLPMVGMPPMKTPRIDAYLEDNQVIKLGETQIKVIHTPGHTQGGVCFLVNNNLFSGDTIFKESVGRCDLPGGNFDQIVESIENKIFTLPNDIVIYPGHGRTTTVGWEKEHNMFM